MTMSGNKFSFRFYYSDPFTKNRFTYLCMKVSQTPNMKKCIRRGAYIIVPEPGL